MGAKKKNEKRKEILGVARWIVPTIILFIYILVVLLTASSKAKKDGRVYAEEKLLDYDKVVADNIMYELSEIRTVADSAAYGMSTTQDYGQAASYLARVTDDGNVTEAFIIDDKGTAVDPDGSEKDVSNEDWYKEAVKETSGSKDTITDALPEDENYILSVAAPAVDNKGLSVIRMSSDFFKNIPDVSKFDGKTQFLFVKADGTIMCTVGGRGLMKGDNLFDGSMLFNCDVPMESVKKVISEGRIGIAYCTVNGEKRALIYRPLKINGWRVCELATESFIESEIARYFAPSRSVYIKIVIALIIFLALIVIMNVIMRAIYKDDQKKLKNKAETDLLTGVLNKISTEQTIQEYLDMVDGEEPGMFLLFDIDNFKKINDTKGHAFGDEVLQAIGRELPTIYRTTDIVGRLGGDEFAVFLKDIPNDNVRKHMGEVTYKFFSNFSVGEYTRYVVTASIGASMYPKDGKNFEELYKSADQAVYAAKKHGRNRLVFYGEEPVDGERSDS